MYDDTFLLLSSLAVCVFSVELTHLAVTDLVVLISALKDTGMNHLNNGHLSNPHFLKLFSLSPVRNNNIIDIDIIINRRVNQSIKKSINCFINMVSRLRFQVRHEIITIKMQNKTFRII